ncbi:hypothetical protein HX021_10240 [Sphingobacterium sp. N143]|uniref:hypothetical protein n=1 Tax=Sphingobacterium sp. N143 TaxID=2746727 RepID=UPI002577E9CB|nr:hypothetical protein [Sphingobacterium sp. N143]MDM1294669.1 hypothetical protein [Sphingobacterium sp. N143]
MKMKLMYAMVLAFVTFAFVGCSKDDDNPMPTGGSIDAAVGTYKGKIDIIGGKEVFNQILVVTKVDDKRIRVSAQNADLKLPVREIQVSNNSNISIQAMGNEPQGNFIYTFENKGLIFLAKRTEEGQLEYSFEGTKQ